MRRRFTGDDLSFFLLRSADDAGNGGGAGSDAGQGGSDADAGTDEETITLKKKDYDSALDRYRNQFGQSEKERKALEKRLQELEAANLTETEKLQAKAKRAEELEPALEAEKARADAAEAVVVALVEKQQKQLPAELQKLLPANASPAEKLAWINDALDAAAKLRPTNGLPPGGGRNPAHQDKEQVTEEQRQQAARHYAGRF